MRSGGRWNSFKEPEENQKPMAEKILSPLGARAAAADERQLRQKRLGVTASS